jgi:hypothetical protein
VLYKVYCFVLFGSGRWWPVPVLVLGLPIASAFATCAEMMFACKYPGNVVHGLQCVDMVDSGTQGLTSVLIAVDVLANGCFMWSFLHRREAETLAHWASVFTGDVVSDAELVRKLHSVGVACALLTTVTAVWIWLAQASIDKGFDAEDMRPCFVIMLNMTVSRCRFQSAIGGASDCIQFVLPLFVTLMWVWTKCVAAASDR